MSISTCNSLASMLRCCIVLIAGMLQYQLSGLCLGHMHVTFYLQFVSINDALQYRCCACLNFDSRHAINFLGYVLDTCMSLSTCNFLCNVISMLCCSFNAAWAWILIAGMLSTFWTMSWTHACHFLLVTWLLLYRQCCVAVSMLHVLGF
jgi:hypothetical protein